jgi:hypothetical protein
MSRRGLMTRVGASISGPWVKSSGCRSPLGEASPAVSSLTTLHEHLYRRPAGLVDVAPQPGTQITGPVRDNGDGTYDVPASWDPGAPGAPGVLVSQPGRDAVPLVPPEARPQPHLGCLVWLLVAIILVLLVVLLIVLIT